MATGGIIHAIDRPVNSLANEILFRSKSRNCLIIKQIATHFFFTFLTSFPALGVRFGSGGVSSIRRNTSSSSWALALGAAGSFTSRLATVGKSHSCNRLQEHIATLPVRRLAMIPTEVELRHIPLKMLPKKKAGALAERRPLGNGSVLLRLSSLRWPSIFPMDDDGNVTVPRDRTRVVPRVRLPAAHRPATVAPMHPGIRPLSFPADAGWRWWPVATVAPACPSPKEAPREPARPARPHRATGASC